MWFLVIIAVVVYIIGFFMGLRGKILARWTLKWFLYTLGAFFVLAAVLVSLNLIGINI